MVKNKFSVVIVTYNRSKELIFALNSVLNQKFKPSEIIIVNNYNIKITKKTLGINNKKIKIFNSKKNLQCAKGRNLGAKMSRSKYIAFLDDDDQWSSNYLFKANKLINNNNSDAILTDIYFLNFKKKILKSIPKLNIQDCFIKNPGCMGSNLIVKKKNFHQLKGYNPKYIPAEDREFLIRMLLKKFKISISKSKVFYNLDSPNQISKNYSLILNGHKNLLRKYKKYINFKNKMFINFKLNKVRYLKEKNYLIKLFYLSISTAYYLTCLMVK